MDLDEHRLAVEAGTVAAAGGAVVALAPGWTWGLATGHPVAFCTGLTVAAGAWVVRWEVREQRIQHALHHLLDVLGWRIEWLQPPTTEGFWALIPPVQSQQPTATEVHDEWMAEIGHELEEVGA